MKTQEAMQYSAVENVKRVMKQIKQKNKEVNALLYTNEDNALEQAEKIDKKKDKGLLAGLTVAVKANISVNDMPVSCASATLENYKGLFDADAVRRIKEEGGVIIGMANCDEFGCGSSGENSAFGATQNPAAKGRVPGGSSSGSAAAVAAGFCDIAIGSDTGGSVRNPASHCGIVGFKPSYGRVSRYGLVDLAMSLDTIGTLSNDAYGSALLMQVIAGKSRYDAKSADKKIENYMAAMKKKKLTIGICDELKTLCTDERIYEKTKETAQSLADVSDGTLQKITLEHIPLAVQTYYPLVFVEFFSATRKFDGRKYGKRIEESCGKEVLRRIEGGREISRVEHQGRYYQKALQVKSLIAQSFAQAFANVDVIALPTTPTLPPRLGEKDETSIDLNKHTETIKKYYAHDAFTTPASLAGICAVSMPMGKIDNIPVGLQLLAPAFKETQLFSAMKMIEELT